MAQTKDRLTVEQLKQEQVFKDLTPRQQKTVETFIESGGDRVAAVTAAYNPKSPEVARVMAYEIFASPKVVACLAAYFQDDPLDVFKAEVRRAYHNRKLTVAQVRAMQLHADLNGWGSASLPNLHGHEDKREPEAASRPEPVTPTGVDSSFIPANAVALVDTEGIVRGYKTADGEYVRLPEVEVTR